MKKPFLLFLYGTALFWIMRTYYKDPANTGMPTPKVLAAPTYLYGILWLASDFTGGFTVPLAAGMTVALIWQTQAKTASGGAAYVGPSPQAQTKFAPESGPGFWSNPPTPAQTKKINTPGFGK